MAHRDVRVEITGVGRGFAGGERSTRLVVAGAGFGALSIRRRPGERVVPGASRAFIALGRAVHSRR